MCSARVTAPGAVVPTVVVEGVADAISYLPQDYFDKQCFNLRDKIFMYDAVIFFKLPDSDNTYDRLKDNNITRDENYIASQQLEDRLLPLWRLHNNLHIIPFAENPAAKYRYAEEVFLRICQGDGAYATNTNK